jgi:aminoglycoside phosphotransferase (APT) family kinase protein
VEQALQEFLARQWPDAEAIEIKDYAIIAGGYSRETYRFDAHVKRGGQWQAYPMILRKDPPPASAILSTSREMEHELLQAVREHTTIPVSQSYFAEMNPETFGDCAMIIERVHGSGEPSLLFNGGPNEDQAESVATHLCELIAQLHLMDPRTLNPDGRLNDPRGVGIDVSSWNAYMDSATEYYVRSYRDLEFAPLPTFYDAYLTLRRERPRPLPLVVAHGDINPANFLYEGGKVTALIDWENCHIGDPREDLGWLALMDGLSNTNIFGSVKEDGGFIGHYNKLTGFDVTPEEVHYFSMFTGGNIGIPVGSAVKRRIDGLCDDILLMYMIQPFCGSSLLFANLLGYPLAPTGAA